jgi:hypothetical protein
MITITCLIGVVVFPSLLDWAWAELAKGPPSENWNRASEVNPMRKQCIEFEAKRLKDMHPPKFFAKSAQTELESNSCYLLRQSSACVNGKRQIVKSVRAHSFVESKQREGTPMHAIRGIVLRAAVNGFI